jgi:hypothetical protein
MGAPYIYIYIYDISSLSAKVLTFILLTWRKWLAPNNASRQQMGFNSGFKGLICFGKTPQIILNLFLFKYCFERNDSCVGLLVKTVRNAHVNVPGGL